MTKKMEPILVLDMSFAPSVLDKRSGPTELLSTDFLRLADERGYTLMPRFLAEDDPRFRQIIPYAVLRDMKGRILSYARGKGAGEQRLVGKRSVGFGGHIDADDAAMYRDGYGQLRFHVVPTISKAISRELKEELGLGGLSLLEPKGLLVGAATDVDRVHLGVVMIGTVTNPEAIESAEGEIELLGWSHPKDLDVSLYEAWSAVVIAGLAAEAA